MNIISWTSIVGDRRIVEMALKSNIRMRHKRSLGSTRDPTVGVEYQANLDSMCHFSAADFGFCELKNNMNPT